MPEVTLNTANSASEFTLSVLVPQELRKFALSLRWRDLALLLAIPATACSTSCGAGRISHPTSSLNEGGAFENETQKKFDPLNQVVKLNADCLSFYSQQLQARASGKTPLPDQVKYNLERLRNEFSRVNDLDLGALSQVEKDAFGICLGVALESINQFKIDPPDPNLGRILGSAQGSCFSALHDVNFLDDEQFRSLTQE